jgi:hypothetical protein
MQYGGGNRRAIDPSFIFSMICGDGSCVWIEAKDGRTDSLPYSPPPTITKNTVVQNRPCSHGIFLLLSFSSFISIGTTKKHTSQHIHQTSNVEHAFCAAPRPNHHAWHDVKYRLHSLGKALDPQTVGIPRQLFEHSDLNGIVIVSVIEAGLIWSEGV